MKEQNFVSYALSAVTVKLINALPEDLQWDFSWAAINFDLYDAEPNFIGKKHKLWILIRDSILDAKNKEAFKKEGTNG